jgi:hypothetical protein
VTVGTYEAGLARHNYLLNIIIANIIRIRRTQTPTTAPIIMVTLLPSPSLPSVRE